ncbi:hypothetical protein N7G274_003660 [Stereocaulon virgatum]|uniref:Uncharacterized protein n=1 Tax=Stereocaulon virgatum TaxID=373712 RepID=A0ABR4AF73_9LECA
MSNNIIKEALVSSPTISESKTSRTDALLKAAIDTAQPARLRNCLRELRKTPPDARKVTAALLLATQQQYRRSIAECTILLNRDEDTEDREESNRGLDQGEYDTSR